MPDILLPDGVTVIKGVPDNLTPEQKKAFAEKIATAYKLPGGFNETVSQANKEERRKREEWLGQRDKLAGAKDERREALRSVDSVDKFAEAYGVKPDEVDPNELWKAYVDFRSKQAPQGVMGSFTQALSRAMPFGGDTQSGRFQDFVSQRFAPKAGRKLADLRVKSNEESYQGATENHPLASFGGEALGMTPLAAAFPGSIGGAVLGGATMAALTPNLSEDPDAYDTGRKALFGGLVGGGSAYGIGQLVKFGTKGRAAIKGELPASAQAEQQKITGALGIPKTDVAAADLVTDNLHPAYQARENARIAGSERVLGAEARNTRALNQRMREMDLAAKTETATTPFSGENPQLGPLHPGEVIQESLPMERATRQREKVTPLYDEAEALLPNDGRRTDTGGLVSQFESMVQTMKDKGAGSIYTHPMASVRGESGPTAISTLETQLQNIRGKAPVAPQGAPVPSVVTGYPPEAESIIKAMRSAGFTDEQVVAGLQSNGFKGATLNKTPGIPTVANVPSNAEAFDTVKKLLDVKDNLQASASAYGLSNDQTHYITKAIAAIDEHLAPYTKSPEWQAHLAKRLEAKRTASQQTMPYHSETVEGLMASLPNRSEDVAPLTAFSKAVGLEPGRMQTVNNLMEQKGQAALREGVLEKAIKGATTEGNPFGLQLTPKPLAAELRAALDTGVLSPDQSSRIEGIINAIQKMQTMGSRNAPVGAMAEQSEVAVSNQRSRLKALWQLRHKMTAPIQYTDAGKAWALTPSALDDPALAGTNLQNFLKILQQRAAPVAYNATNSNVDNPMPIPE